MTLKKDFELTFFMAAKPLLRISQAWLQTIIKKKQIDCKAGTTAEGQNLLANISTSRASFLQGQYFIKENFNFLIFLY